MVSLDYKGKKIIQNLHLGVEYHQLVPDKKKSLTEKISLEDNLILHGDNLKALKALLPNYANKIKCIYIDPPYNTGNEGWKYNDNVNSPMIQEWLGKEVGADDLTRHDKWLCMMTPRLKLLRELLSDDGVIFISIDDNEQHRLRALMDEIFGEENFITNIIWQKKYSPQNDANYFSDMHDFMVVYAKHKNIGDEKAGWIRNLLPRTEEQNARYDNPDNDSRGVWKSSDLSVKTYSKDYDYPIKTPSGRIVNPPQGRCWVTSKDRVKELIKDNRIWFGPNGDGVPSVKKFLSEVQQGTVPTTIWFREDVGDNQEARQSLKDIFSEVDFPFENPKPFSLIEQVLRIATDKDSIILDSFAGSGTTAHAVLDLNNEDGGNRKFILVECEDYADSITAERVRRVIRGVKGAKDEKLREGLGGSFSFFELGDAIDLKGILSGKSLPSYQELARYVYYTATGEEFVEKRVDQKSSFIGESRNFEVYLIYKPDIAFLKTAALNTKFAEGLGLFKGKRRLVFAPANFLDASYLAKYSIDFCQLPYEIYRIKG
jgi:adenine-specific DNA-methyltransferase